MDRYEELIREMKREVPVGESFDLLERKLNIGGKEATMFFADGLVDGGMMQRVIFSLFSLTPEKVERARTAKDFLESNMPFLDALVWRICSLLSDICIRVWYLCSYRDTVG